MNARTSLLHRALFRRWLLIGAAVVFFVAVFLIRIRGDMVDFEVNLKAAQRLRAGESLYQRGDGHFMFKYFPVSAVLYLPLSTLPLSLAMAIWYGLSVLCVVALFVVSRRLVTGSAERLPWYVVVGPPLVLAKFCLRELKLGQINAMVTFILLLTVASLLSERGANKGWRAGMLWGFATALKPYGLIFLPYFVIKRNLNALLGGAVVLVAAFLLPAAFYGFRGNIAVWREWYQTLSESTPSQFAVADNVSLVGFFSKWMDDPSRAPAFAAVGVGLAAFMMLALIWRGRHLARSEVLECGVLLTLIPLISPLGWDYQLLTSVLVVTILLRRVTEFGVPARAFLILNFAVIALSIFDVIGRAAYSAFMSWSILTINFAILLLYVAILRFRRLA